MRILTLSNQDRSKEWEYVKEQLVTSGFDSFGGGTIANYPFRSRFLHTTRVMLWASRILGDCPQADPEMLELAIIFHDVGYSKGVNKSHQEESANLFEAYRKEKSGGIWDNASKMESIAWMIRNHSKKEMLRNGEATPELTLLMEADMLDEEGMLRIVWDAMATGYLGEGGFEETLKRTIHYWNPDYMPMVTPLAARHFEEKQKAVKTYIEQMKYDLGIM
ncbi:HD superfamily phosphodieaserase, includes HD domain of RNase Y [Lachnospiraceae bacterium XBB1006]|nr:HD superfamily phosphodieaserase, includes HD domain of RNase Y [Lachnospiraceae bacterium XBB1006]